MKRTLEILNEPDQVVNILNSLRKDSHLAKTFEGEAKNGSLNGFYTNLALLNGIVIGYVKIRGLYNCEKGDLKIDVVPSNLYWIVMTFAVLVVAFLTYKGFNEDKLFFIGTFLFLFMALGWTIAFVFESRSFIKHMNRIINLTIE